MSLNLWHLNIEYTNDPLNGKQLKLNIEITGDCDQETVNRIVRYISRRFGEGFDSKPKVDVTLENIEKLLSESYDGSAIRGWMAFSPFLASPSDLGYDEKPVPLRKWRQRKTSNVKPERVICNPPATIVFFDDGSKVVAKTSDGTEYDPYTGVAVCIAKRTLADLIERGKSPNGTINRLIKESGYEPPEDSGDGDTDG